MNFYKSVGGKLIISVLVLLVLGLTLLTVVGVKMAKDSQNSNLKERLEMLAGSTITSLEDMMITGNAGIVHDWIKGMKRVRGITVIQVLRKNGVEAFSDNETIKHVNGFLESDDFDPRSQDEMEDAEGEAGFNKEPVDNVKLTKVVNTKGTVFYKEILHYRQVLTIMTPILLREECLLCHGYDPNPVRGVIRLSVPTAPMEKAISTQEKGLIGISIATVLLVLIGLYFLVAKIVTLPIGKIGEGIKLTADGDMTVDIDINSGDELGILTEDFNGMVDKLNKKSTKINILTDTTTASASVLEELSHDLAVEVKKQLNQTEQIAAAAEELSTSVKEVERNGNTANESSGDVLVAATNGKGEIEKAVREVRTVESSSKISVKLIETLGVRSSEIGQVLTVIMDIADQTNLLALNAAIEAARAGEQGRGFAVVADEVRKLAERTMGATRSIADTIESIQGDTKKAVEQISIVSSQATEGLMLTEKAGSTYEEIIGKIETTAAMIAEMARATKEQAIAAEEIAKKVTSVNAIAAESSENATLTAEALKEMKAGIANISQELSDYKLK